MILIYSRLLVTDSKTPQKPELIREERLSYDEILKEVCVAISDRYELTYLSEGEFHHAVVFLKYGAGDKYMLILAIRGTKEEIESLQSEPSIKKYFGLP